MDEAKCKELTAMDWGQVTPEFSRGYELVHVFNHQLTAPEAVERTLRFIRNRLYWCNTYLDDRFTHTVVLDDVGQTVSDRTREQIRQALADCAATVRFVSEE